MGMTVTNIAGIQMNDNLLKLASMKKINTAADDAAGESMSEKLQSEIAGLSRGTENTLDMQNLLSTAEGGLSAIDENLQQIRTLSVQASSDANTDEDRALIQNEITQLMEGINDIASGTQFNHINLLDGSFTNRMTASSSDGSGVAVSIPDAGTQSLGIRDFDVRGSFDLSAIDDAISSVSSTRSYLGSLSNRMDYNVSSNSITLLNQAAAKSRMADLDVAKTVTDANRDRILNEAQLYTQKNLQERQKDPISLML